MKTENGWNGNTFNKTKKTKQNPNDLHAKRIEH